MSAKLMLAVLLTSGASVFARAQELGKTLADKQDLDVRFDGNVAKGSAQADPPKTEGSRETNGALGQLRAFEPSRAISSSAEKGVPAKPLGVPVQDRKGLDTTLTPSDKPAEGPHKVWGVGDFGMGDKSWLGDGLLALILVVILVAVCVG